MVAEKVVVQLVLDTSRYTSNAGKAAQSTAKIQTATDKTSKSLGGLQSTALKAGVALGAAFAAKAALNFAKSAINAFSTLEESVNAVNVVYLEGSDAIHALGENSAIQFGLSTTAVNQAAVAMSAFADKIDEADPPGAFANVLQRATDFASVMDLEVNDALRLFQSGLAGESEPLRKFGIDVSAATITTVGLAAGLGDANGKLSEGEKVQARYLAIMEQTEKTAGDFAATSESIANRQKTLNALWVEAQATLGEKLAPAMQKLLELGVKLVPVLGPVGDIIGEVVDQVVLGFEAVEKLVEVAAALGIEFGDTADGARTVGGELKDLAAASVTATSLWDKFWHELIKVPWAPEAEKAAEFTGTLDLMANKERRVAEETDFLAGLLPVVSGALDTTAAAAAGAGRAAGTAAGQFNAQAAAIRGVTSAAREAASPALALLRAQERVVAAEVGLREARVAGKPASDDVIAATADLIEAELERDAAAIVVTGTFIDGQAAIREYGDASIATAGEVDALVVAIAGIPTTKDIQFTATFRGFERIEQLTGSGGLSDTFGPAGTREHGGPVTAGGAFLVGERGPELFIPNSGGQIVANNKLGGQSIVVNVNEPTTTDLAADLSAGLIAAQITQQVEMMRV